MAKTPEQRIESLERRVNLYRILVTLLFAFILILQRQRIVGWIDNMESWFGQGSSYRS